MRKLGRCGRRRRQKYSDKMTREGQSQAHLPVCTQLRQWMKALTPKGRKIEAPLVPAEFKSTGRGLGASKRIKAGDTIISLPLDILITTDTVFQSELRPILFRSSFTFTPQQLLALFLVYERQKGERSSWSPYIKSLPSVYSTPLYFSTAEVDLLPPWVKSLAQETRQRFYVAKRMLRSFIRRYLPDLYAQTSFELDQFLLWAWSSVDTRSVYLESSTHPLLDLDPAESNVALAPFLDLLNHTDTAQVSVKANPETRCYEIQTCDTYKKFDQVFISYGPHDNAKLLVNYGFTLPRNCHNAYVFTIDDIVSCVPSAKECLDQKQALLKSSGLSKHLTCDGDGVSWSLNAALKLVHLSRDQLSCWKRLLQGLDVSTKTEEKAKESAKELIETALHKARDHCALVERSPQLEHHTLLHSVSLDDVRILEKALDTLNDR